MLNANESLQSNTSITEHDNGTFTVSSSYTFMANRSMDGEEFVCNGFHPALQTPMEYRVVIYLVRMYYPSVCVRGRGGGGGWNEYTFKGGRQPCENSFIALLKSGLL